MSSSTIIRMGGKRKSTDEQTERFFDSLIEMQDILDAFTEFCRKEDHDMKELFAAVKEVGKAGARVYNASKGVEESMQPAFNMKEFLAKWGEGTQQQ